MRLLVPTRILLALRMATNPPVRAPQHRRKLAATAAPTTVESLQQLWELSKSRGELSLIMKRELDNAKKGDWPTGGLFMSKVVQQWSDMNDFASMDERLEAHARYMKEEDKTPDVREVTDILWSAIYAKSMGALSPSMINWIDEAILRLPEPIPVKKESMIWMLSILRGDLPTLQQLQQESIKRSGVVGPEIEREKTLNHAAMVYLDAGKEEQFRSLWTSSGTSLMENDCNDSLRQPVMLHHAMLRRAKSGKPDPVMLRWYVDSIATDQRTPIPEKPHFENMMVPVIKSLGGKIEKWKQEDHRIMKLRKWRDDYGKSEMENLLKSLLDYMRHEIEVDKRGNNEDLRRLERMIARVERDDEKRGTGRRTVVVDWLNFGTGVAGIPNGTRAIYSLFSSYSLIVVGREMVKGKFGSIRSPAENDRIKVMEVTRKVEKRQEIDDLCSIILAVATHGHLMSNDRVRCHVSSFARFLQNKSNDIRQSTLLKNYLNDAVLRYNKDKIQPTVDHSNAAQWVDKEKKELAFTVARKSKEIPPDHCFRIIDHYSLHID